MKSNNIKFVQGNEACVEGAMYAGLEFFRRIPHHTVDRDGRMVASLSRWKMKSPPWEPLLVLH